MSFRQRMTPMSIIVALDERGGFGKDGKIPWHFPEDFKHFQEVTKGHVCVMGRKTYEDMLEMRLEREAKKAKGNKAIKEYLTVQNNGETPSMETLDTSIKEILPGRLSFVVTSDKNFKAPGATVVSGLREAVQSLSEDDMRTVYVLGGYRMFVEALSWVDKIEMTVVKGSYDCDRHFPVNVLNKSFKIVSGKETDDLYFVTYQRKG